VSTHKKNLICSIKLADIWLAKGDELNLILPKFVHPLYFFPSSGFLILPLIFLDENSQYFGIFN